ncbi:hypothetical protein KFF05_09980 [bacterium SCSIO 12827]|nr:hypothetical protein KFF05_09980 [bacterium SCSIO 12827]
MLLRTFLFTFTIVSLIALAPQPRADEAEAKAMSLTLASFTAGQIDFAGRFEARKTSPTRPGVTLVQRGYARVCLTSLGACPLGVALPVGAQCVCYTPYGPVPGVAR